MDETEIKKSAEDVGEAGAKKSSRAAEEREQDDMSKVRRDLINRMRRIEGQARGIAKMLEEGRDCADVAVQMAAMRAAINRAGMKMLATHFMLCLAKGIEEGTDPGELVEYTTRIFMRFS